MIELIITMRNDKVRILEIAEKMNISASYVHKILNSNWSRVTFRESDKTIRKEKEPDEEEVEKKRKEEENNIRREQTKIFYQEAVIRILYDLGNSRLMISRQLNIPYSVIDKIIK